jgi:hypothetical protein
MSDTLLILAAKVLFVLGLLVATALTTVGIHALMTPHESLLKTPPVEHVMVYWLPQGCTIA